MEPFFLRCETCHARLKVRDEQFLGQVQSCPKCGSMVQILAPAGWLATDEATPSPERRGSRGDLNSARNSHPRGDAPARASAVGRPVPALRCWSRGVVAVFALSRQRRNSCSAAGDRRRCNAGRRTDKSVAASRAAIPRESNRSKRSRAARSGSGQSTPIQPPPSPAAEVERVAAVTEPAPRLPAPPQPASATVQRHGNRPGR